MATAVENEIPDEDIDRRSSVGRKESIKDFDQEAPFWQPEYDFSYPVLLLPVVTKPIKDMTLDQFTDIQHLADGSNANVYTATYNNATVVIKKIKDEMKQQVVAVHEFDVEHGLLARIDHPNIIKIIGAGMDGDRKFLVLQHLAGGTLRSKLDATIAAKKTSLFSSRKKTFVFAEMLQHARELALALDHLHRGVKEGAMLLHRDLKPDNVAFLEDGSLVLFDLGLCTAVKARATADETYAMTGCTGSLRYMAPEVALGQPYNDKADLYSFGVLMWQMASDEVPFAGASKADYLKFACAQGDRPNMVYSWPKEFKALVAACWHEDSRQRPSFKEVVAALDALIAKNPSSANNTPPPVVLGKKRPEEPLAAAEVSVHATKEEKHSEVPPSAPVGTVHALAEEKRPEPPPVVEAVAAPHPVKDSAEEGYCPPVDPQNMESESVRGEDARVEITSQSTDHHTEPVADIHAEHLAAPEGEAENHVEPASEDQYTPGASPVDMDDSAQSLTPVMDMSTRKKSASFSMNETATSLFRNIRKTYSFDNYKDLTATKLFERGESISPIQESSNLLLESTEMDSFVDATPVLEETADLEEPRDEQQPEEDEEEAPEDPIVVEAEPVEEQPEEEPQDESAALYEKYKSAWTGKSGSVALPTKVSSSVSFGSSNRNSTSSLFAKPKKATAHDRLHASHSARLKKLNKKIEQQQRDKDDIEASELEYKWQLSDKSRQLAGSTRTISDDVGERLYLTGVKEREKRLTKTKLFESAPKPPAQWSCVKCGSIKDITTEKLFDAVSKGRTETPKTVKCACCGHVGPMDPTFAPVNVALSFPVRKSGAEELAKSLASNRKWASGEGEGGLHEYLHSHPKINEKKYAMTISAGEEANQRKMPFKPKLPKTSHQIINSFKSAGGTSTEAYMGGTEFSEDKARVGEYFGKAAEERLYENSAPEIKKHRETGTIGLRPRKEHIPYMFTGSGDGGRKPVYGEPISTKTFQPVKTKAPKKVDDDGWDGIVHRLLTEEEKRVKRLNRMTKEARTVDEKTGQPLWKPKIPEPLEIEGKVVGVAGPQSSFNLILLKEKQRQERKQIELKRHYEEEQEYLRSHQFKVDRESAAIAEDATNRGIEEIFKVLLASVQLSPSYDLDLDKAYEISKVATEMRDWSIRLLDVTHVKQGMLIPDVMELVVEAFQLHYQRVSQTSNLVSLGSELDNGSLEPSMLIDFHAFSSLMHAAIKRRRSLGLDYPIAARKRHQLAIELNRKRDKDAVFAPDISLSQSAVEISRERKNNVSLADSLIESGQRRKARIDAVRTVEMQARMSETFTFQPTLIKPPATVKPRYRGVVPGAMPNQSEPSFSTTMTTEGAEEESEEPLAATSDMMEEPLASSSHYMHTADDAEAYDAIQRHFAESEDPFQDDFDDISAVSDVSTAKRSSIFSSAMVSQQSEQELEAEVEREGDDEVTEAVFALPDAIPTNAALPVSSRKPFALSIYIPMSADSHDDPDADAVTEIMETQPNTSSTAVLGSPKSVKFDENNIAKTTTPRAAIEAPAINATIETFLETEPSPRRRLAVHSHDQSEEPSSDVIQPVFIGSGSSDNSVANTPGSDASSKEFIFNQKNTRKMSISSIIQQLSRR